MNTSPLSGRQFQQAWSHVQTLLCFLHSYMAGSLRPISVLHLMAEVILCMTALSEPPALHCSGNLMSCPSKSLLVSVKHVQLQK